MPPIAAEEPLIAFLADRDVPCPCCGYNLRDLTSDCCPECRRRVVLTITIAEPPIVQFVLAVIGLASCGAVFAFFFVLILSVGLVEGDFPSGMEAVIYLLIPALIAFLDIPVVVFMLRIRFRRWFALRSRAGRWGAIFACWMTSIVAVGAWLTVLLMQ